MNNDKEAERAEPQKLVFGLLDYIEQVEKLSAKPAFSIPSDAPFVAYQHDFKELPELQFNLQIEGDDVWLRIPRLQKIAAPDPEDALRPWITLPKYPEKRPEIKGEITVSDDKREARLERLEDHPEISELFDWYVEYQWKPWAKTERLRRKTMAFYNKLFSLHQAISLEGAETPLELVWGIGYSIWKKEGHATALKYPLLLQACEVRLDEQTFALEVRPRDVEPRLETDCFVEMDVPGVMQLEAHWKTTLAASANRVNPFDLETYEDLLKVAVTYLDASGKYEVQASDAAPSAPEGTLKITNTWVLFGRKRSSDIFIDDIHRLKEKVEEIKKKGGELPSVIRRFVEHGDTTVRVNPEQAFRGLSASDSGIGAMELYFPMPYNDEQVSIVQKLYANDGVVVQGPPGTGKTHTIANVICHYLAQGKRVLVTSKGESALSVLQEKLPEAVRPLSVSLLSDERDGMKQFEHSIQTIAAEVAGINPSRMEANIKEAETKLNQLHAKIVHVDYSIVTYAANHMCKCTFQGREVTPGEMAKLVLEQTKIHEWFDDEPPSPKDGTQPTNDAEISSLIFSPTLSPFNEAEVNTLRRARIALGKDLVYLGCKLPAPDDFPAWADLLSLRRDLVKVQINDAKVAQGELLALADSRPETFEKAQSAATFLNQRMTLKAKLAAAHLPWLEGVSKHLANMQAQDPRLLALQAVLTDIRKLEHQRRGRVAKAVNVPVDAELNPDYIAAVDRLISGQSAFGLSFGKTNAKKLLAGTTVTGSPPAAPEDWMLVHETLGWRVETRKVLARWNALATNFGLAVPPAGLETGFGKIAQWQASIDDARKLIFDFNAKLRTRLEEVLGQTTVNKMWNGGERFVAASYTSLQAHIDKERLAYAPKQSQALIDKLDGHGSIVDELRGFFTGSFGQTSADESALQSKWLTLHAELARLTALQPYFAEVGRITDAIESAGATRWAKRLRSEPASPDLDPITPASWLDAWNWRQAVMFLDRIDEHHKLRKLFTERRTLTGTLARTYQDLVAEKAWLGVFNNSPPVVRQALQAYLNAVQAMGAGIGIRAVRFRRNARAAMARAYQAVPCWILPQWRVSETIPPEIGLFDLIVIDEASQSDIWALPSLLRGKKVLVVGDHKQVSPSAVGIEEKDINELYSRFLKDQPHGAEMVPGKSIYDLARVVFAGNSVMLKEHFRCVPAIIEFSNREFYSGDIKPLRVPKANERLDPPLIDVFVKGGNRKGKGDINEPEAKAIVDEIKTILADPAFDKRSIGVVTLLGNKQAAHIDQLINNEISPDVVVARKIVVGSPPMFQGRERDIMMVSMVLASGDRAAANRLDIEQRFNVALSRARDRMYLFRSVSDTEFQAGTLNGKLISHFKQPFHSDIRQVQTLRGRCDSDFEREMFDELVQRGYRVEPQVRSGGYYIDFVVEGNEGRRLAIECDGDRFHERPDQWKKDMARQRVLERAGWTFWRCFASSFVRCRQKVLDDLCQTLEGLGIQPLGAESLDNTVWVHHKEVDPLGVEEAQEVD